MAEYTGYRLAMRSPLHVGEMGVGVEETLSYMPSDTLFGALVLTWLELGKRALVDELDASLADAPPVLLSSAFPYAGDVFLLPKPQLPIAPEGAKSKEFKRVRWVSSTIIGKLAAGISQLALNDLWDARVTVQRKSIWLDSSDKARLGSAGWQSDDDDFLLWATRRVPRVVVDRVTSASQLFHVGRVHFAPGCGLWLLAQGAPYWLEALDQALFSLGDTGFGGQRSRGHGQFTPERASVTIDVPDQATYGMLLSRFAPLAAHMDRLRLPLASYQLVTIGGYTGTPGHPPLVRRSVRMLTEGSIIGMEGGPTPGRLVDVNPNNGMVKHPVHRYGYGFLLPFQPAL